MIIRALPGSGKTWVKEHLSSCVDTDDIIAVLSADGKASKSNFESIMSDERRFARLVAALEEADALGLLILTNLDTTPLTREPDALVGYRVDDYIRHLAMVGRNDLLMRFSPIVLQGWAHEYELKGAFFLKAGSFLADYLALLPDPIIAANFGNPQ